VNKRQTACSSFKVIGLLWSCVFVILTLTALVLIHFHNIKIMARIYSSKKERKKFTSFKQLDGEWIIIVKICTTTLALSCLIWSHTGQETQLLESLIEMYNYIFRFKLQPELFRVSVMCLKLERLLILKLNLDPPIHDLAGHWNTVKPSIHFCWNRLRLALVVELWSFSTPSQKATQVLK